MSYANVRATAPGAGRQAFGARFLVLLGLGLALAFSCTPPDRGIVVDGSLGGTAGEGTGGSFGGESSGGRSSGGASSGGAPTGGTGGGSGGGSGGGEPASCEDSGDCTNLAEPVCDDAEGECRPCGAHQECEELDAGRPYCGDGGTCDECRTVADCPTGESICDDGACRGCQEHSECESLVCRTDGSCEDPTAIVYALAATGDLDEAACGTIDQPCRRLTDAVAHLSASRPVLALVPTSASFEDFGALTLPAGVDVTIVGHLVEVPLGGNPGILVASGTTVVLEQVALIGSGGVEADPEQILVSADGATVVVRESTFEESHAALSGDDAVYHVTDSHFSNLFQGGVVSYCATDCVGVPASSVERSRFEYIGRTGVSLSAADSYVANNLFIEVATVTYATGLELRGGNSTAEFNTLIRSGNCAFNGLIYCGGHDDTVLRGNITYQSSHREEGMNNPTPCYEQVYSSCPNPQYSISEVTMAGTGNITDDPLFVDAAADFHLSAESPAVDLAPSGTDTDAELDLDQNVRPAGDGYDAGAYERQ